MIFYFLFVEQIQYPTICVFAFNLKENLKRMFQWMQWTQKNNSLKTELLFLFVKLTLEIKAGKNIDF